MARTKQPTRARTIDVPIGNTNNTDNKIPKMAHIIAIMDDAIIVLEKVSLRLRAVSAGTTSTADTIRTPTAFIDTAIKAEIVPIKR